jgi:hypothetical protein
VGPRQAQRQQQPTLQLPQRLVAAAAAAQLRAQLQQEGLLRVVRQDEAITEQQLLRAARPLCPVECQLRVSCVSVACQLSGSCR